MVSCLAASQYTMLVDILDQVTTRHPETNEKIRTWAKIKTIPCYVYPYLDGGVKGAGTTEKFTELYGNSDYARIRTSTQLNKRYRLANVRAKRGGQVVFADLEVDPTGKTGTVYNVDGSSPMINNITGRANEFISTLSRADVRG